MELSSLAKGKELIHHGDDAFWFAGVTIRSDGESEFFGNGATADNYLDGMTQVIDV